VANGSCSAIRADGGRCRGVPIRASEWCASHHPDTQQARQRGSKKGGRRGGRGRPAAEVGELKKQLSDLYTSVLTGMTEPKIGSVLAQIGNARIRLVETELRVKEQLELEARLEQLESLLENQKEAQRA
jgi:hypothetical protein